MTTRQKSSPPLPASISLRDVYYVLFRHKWLTAVLMVLGIGCSLAVYERWPFPYVSEAKLYVRYIQEAAAPAELEGNHDVKSPDDRGANILNTELEILASLDTAKTVARLLGPDRILVQPLPTKARSANEAAAGEFILSHLRAEVPTKSDVILLHYSARDPMLAQHVLSALITAYKNSYVSNHLSMGINEDFLQKQTAEAKSHLQDTMRTLEAEKEKVGVISLADSKKNVTDMLFKTQESIYEVRAEMAETEAIVKDIQERGTNALTYASASNPSANMVAPAPPEQPAPEVLDKYRNLSAVLATRRAEEQKWMTQLSASSERVRNLQQQRAAAEAEVNKFGADHPGLLPIKTNASASPALILASSADLMATLRSSETRQHALAARFIELTNQLAQVEANAEVLNSAEDAITKAETEKVVADAKYKRFLASQEQARLDLAIGNRISNITTAEQPTPGSRDSKKILKTTLSVLGLFLALAFGLPFFIEMVLDQSFKEPMDVKARIDAPFFITIPSTNGHRHLAAPQRTNSAALLAGNGAAKPGSGMGDGTATPSSNSQVANPAGRHELRPFFETLRDRLMTYFEMINLSHKPKLVAVTSCNQGAGVTTTAAGLASSLSEIKEGHVLLVNMNIQNGETHHFYRGKMDCGIEEVLGAEKRDQAQVQEHLFVVKETASGDSLPRALPRRFSKLVPLMKASDYDYIIFDMPPVSEISITPRLARFMDMVLLVIESERTSREAGIRSASLFGESKTSLGLVLNKNRSYLPKRLQHI